ncbi:MAG: hypothetical protein GYA15_03900 [Leptolinea sp.]|jgi:hypothetical protein|nr:hypothetical protein [Leptolinea sp.]
MKILTIEFERVPVDWKEIDPALLKAEARHVFNLQQADLIRQIHFTADTKRAVIEWEADSLEKVKTEISSFPLVQAGLIDFEYYPLAPYSGFNTLFG